MDQTLLTDKKHKGKLFLAAKCTGPLLSGFPLNKRYMLLSGECTCESKVSYPRSTTQAFRPRFEPELLDQESHPLLIRLLRFVQ